MNKNRFNYLTKNEIDAQTSEMGIKLNLLSFPEEQVCFFPSWIFSYDNNSLYAESPYDKFVIIEKDINKFIIEAELKL